MGMQHRLIGIDVFRGLAIFAVIILHIDEGVSNLPHIWLRISHFAFFAVPFFLTAAFYFAISKLYSSNGQYPIVARSVRLLIPYAVWSVLYLLYKSAKSIIDNDFERLLESFQDPLSIVFFGGASYHLYFLPLLVIGTFLIKFVEFLIHQKVSLRNIGLITLASVLVYELVLFSGNGMIEQSKVAFQPLLTSIYPAGTSNSLIRLFLVELFWALRCLPYVMLAMVLAHPNLNQVCLKLLQKYWMVVLLIFLTFNLWKTSVLPPGVREIGTGYTALLAAIALSGVLKENPLIKSIGLCSFGIYLIHIFFVEVYQSIAVRLIPDYSNRVSTITLLTASIAVLLISWITTTLLMRNKKISQLLYGV